MKPTIVGTPWVKFKAVFDMKAGDMVVAIAEDGSRHVATLVREDANGYVVDMYGSYVAVNRSMVVPHPHTQIALAVIRRKT